jgi:hypothetical protein
MHFRGQATRAGGNPKLLKATSSGTSSTVTTIISAAGLESHVKPEDGQLAFFESEVRLTGPDSFEESGTITLGDDGDHLLRFSTIGQGHLSPSLEPGIMAGTVSWKIEGGEGQFAGAQGFITSTFLITESGDLSDYQSALIFLPS